MGLKHYTSETSSSGSFPLAPSSWTTFSSDLGSSGASVGSLACWPGLAQAGNILSVSPPSSQATWVSLLDLV